MFVARKNELKTLNKFYNRDSLDLIALYGRRRVGKTELLKEFTKDKNHLFFSAEETTERLNLEKLSELYGNKINTGIGLINSWEVIFSYLIKLSHKERLIIVIDEFPYLSSNNPGFLSKFQHIIDHMLMNTNIMIILCGSSISFMENEVLSEKSPLFGRLTGQMFIKPFDYYDASKMLENYSYINKLEAYFLVGGIPQYLKKLETNKSIKDNILEKMLDTSEELFNAPANLIRQELRSPAIYNAILEAVSNGYTKSNEINTKIGVVPNTGQNYINTLINIHLLNKKTPTGGQSRRKTVYSVSDALFDFIYRFAYRYKSLLDTNLEAEVYENYIEGKLASHFGKRFEIACTEYVNRLNGQAYFPEFLLETGSWWGGNPLTKVEEEIDIVGLGENFGLYCECKYQKEPLSKSVLDELIRKSLLIPKAHMHYYLFSKSGFKENLIDYAKDKDYIRLITIDDLYLDIK
ncbi:ATP-binding protein [Acidaminobacter sp. JC074]|uniref:ATP-binding protein n=1 Tax=Acidaminobacter sp. JC074 TaxID=2530199 RepID=UPI001F0D7815|nr:ATP-binding protein [Acidaminobacter sp. JC074]MCH4890330.1 ATP-binding protein [Acidaminobacter sp. JC074]